MAVAAASGSGSRVSVLGPPLKMDSPFLLMEVAGRENRAVARGGFREAPGRGGFSDDAPLTVSLSFRLHLMPEGKHNLHLRFADEFNELAEDFLR